MNRLHRLLALRDRVEEAIAAELNQRHRVLATRQALPAMADIETEPTIILDAVAAEFGLTGADVLGASRSTFICDARSAIAWIARSEGLDVPTTAALIGRNPSSVHSYVNRVRGRSDLLERAEAVRARLSGTEHAA